jgi:DNA-binding CsgD family transcriptional regulator
LLAESFHLTESVQDRWHGFHNRVTRAMLDVAGGRHNDAIAAVGTLADELDEIGIRDPGIFLFEREAIEAFVAVGEEERARALVERLERTAVEFARPRALASAFRGRALLAGHSDEAFAAYEAALREHERFDDPLDRARTLLLFGIAERRARSLRAARGHLTEAAAAFEQIGARGFAARAHDELERLGGRRTSDGLTATEHRVAELVAQGLTNGEVATALVVTVSTVEAHLTRIYAKLGIRSRAQLARSLAGG